MKIVKKKSIENSQLKRSYKENTQNTNFKNNKLVVFSPRLSRENII